MMQFIRDHANSKFAKFLFLGIGISFLGWGGSGFFNQTGLGDIAKVNGVKVHENQVKNAYASLINQLGVQSPNEADTKQIKAMALQQVIEQIVLEQKLHDWKITASNEDVVKVLMSEPSFFDETGKFNSENYKKALSYQGYTPEMYEGSIRQKIALQKTIQSIINSIYIGDQTLDSDAALIKERRSIELVKIPFDDYRDQVTVSGEEIKGEYDKNPEAYKTKEAVKLEYIELSEAPLETITVTDEEINAAIALAIEKQKKDEARDSDQLIVEFDTEAEKIAALDELNTIYNTLINNTLTFDEAKEKVAAIKNGHYYETGINLRGVLGDEFDNELFALTKENSYSKPFATESTVHLIRLLNIVSDIKTGEALKTEVVNQLKKDKNTLASVEKETKMQELSEQHTDTLEVLAKELELSIQTTDWLMFGEATGFLASEKVREALADELVMKQGKNSVPFVNNGKATILRLADHRPSRVETLDEATVEIKEVLLKSKLTALILEKTESLKAALNESSTAFKEKAESLGLDYAQYDDLMISNITTLSDLNDFKIRALISAFGAPVPESGKKTIIIETLDEGIAVSAIDKVTAGTLADYNEEEKKARTQQLMLQISDAEYKAIIRSLMESSKIEQYSNDYMKSGT